jgi:hypothetical protein
MARAGVTMSSTFDPTRLRAGVSDDLDTGLVRLAADVEADTRDRWSGWRDGTGKSQRAWEAIAEVEANATRGEVILANDARNEQGEPYAQHVHRAGDRTPEIVAVQQRLQQIAAPHAGEMGEMIADTLNTPGPARERR